MCCALAIRNVSDRILFVLSSVGMYRQHARGNTVLADYVLRAIDRNVSDRPRSSYVRMSDF